MAAATISHLRRGHALLCLSRRHFSSAATASPLAITARRLVSTLVDHGTSSTGEAARPRPSAPTPPPSRYQHLAGRGGSSAVRRRQGRKNASTLVDHGKSLTGEATRPRPSTPTPPPSRHRRLARRGDSSAVRWRQGQEKRRRWIARRERGRLTCQMARRWWWLWSSPAVLRWEARPLGRCRAEQEVLQPIDFGELRRSRSRSPSGLGESCPQIRSQPVSGRTVAAEEDASPPRTAPTPSSSYRRSTVDEEERGGEMDDAMERRVQEEA